MKKRKFFSFMLMGLLTLGATSMVTSCKDYDDDINNLQTEQASLTSQINTLQSTLSSVQSAAASHATTTQLEAVQSQVTSQGTQLNSLASQVTTAISNAQSASDAATAAQTAVNNLKAQVDAIDLSGFATKDQLANYVTASALNTQLETFKQEIQSANAEQLQQIKNEVAKYTSAINSLYTAVTSVELVGVFGDNDNLFQNNGDGLDISFYTGPVYGVTRNNKNVITANATSATDVEDRTSLTFGQQDPDQKSGSTYITQQNAVDNTTYYHNATPTQVFTPGTQIQDKSVVLVRVSPTNAELTKDMVKLITSDGKQIEGVTVDDVEPFTSVLTRATSAGALWKVTLSLDDDAEILTADADNTVYEPGTTSGTYTATTSGNYIESTLTKTTKNGYTGYYRNLYAVAVNNTADSLNRDVVSTYDISFKANTTFQPSTSLNTVKVYSESAGSTGAYTLSQLKGYGYNKISGNTTVVGAQNGENVTVEFDDATDLKGVAYFYVDLDRNYAGEDGSDQSEPIAWDSYKYSGLQQIQPVVNGKGTATFNVSIPTTLVNGDDIAFRVFAVNYDGTYTVLGGQPFVVHVGANSSSTDVTNAQIKVTSATATDNVSEWYSISGLKNGTIDLYTTGTGASATWSSSYGIADLKVGDTTVPFEYQTANALNDDGSVKTAANSNSNIKYIRFRLNTAPANWEDGSTATGKIVGTATNGLLENTINVSIKKVLPTVADATEAAGFEWQANQLNGNTWTAYVFAPSTSGTPDWGTAASTGEKNFLSAATIAHPANVSLTIANTAGTRHNIATTFTSAAQSYTSGTTTTTVPDGSISKMIIDKAVIDGTTEHASSINYNYGAITSDTETYPNGYTLDIADFNTIFVDPLPSNTYAWRSDSKYGSNGAVTYTYKQLSLTYPSNGSTTDVTPNGLYTGEKFIDAIAVTNPYDQGTFGGTSTAIANSSVPANDWYKKFVSVESASLISDGQTNGYFTVNTGSFLSTGEITFTPVPGLANPTADVPSTLTIVLKDWLDNTSTISLKMNVKQSADYSNPAKQK